MKKLLLIISFFSSCNLSFGQSKFNDLFYTDTVNVGYAKFNLQELEYFPKDYFSSNKTYPLILFAHGRGEAGTNLLLMTRNGPLHFISKTWQPGFIIIAPQANNGWSITPVNIDSALIQAVRKYRVDVNKIYITGLSAGGQGIWQYAGHNKINPALKVAAMIPMSMATTAVYAEAKNIAADNIVVWGFGDPKGDLWGLRTMQAIDSINKYQPRSAEFTSYSGGHCCWNNFYNPSYKKNNLSIYDWMLLQSRSDLLPVKLQSFELINTGGKISLQWQTASEQNNNYFIIQGSQDGENFVDIDKVKSKAPKGNSATLLSYNYAL